MTNYWTLAHRVRPVVLLNSQLSVALGSVDERAARPASSNGASGVRTVRNDYHEVQNVDLMVPVPALRNAHLQTKVLYEALCDFHQNSFKRYQEFHPTTGYQRRAFRHMCDELGLRSKLKYMTRPELPHDPLFLLAAEENNYKNAAATGQANLRSELAGSYCVCVWKDSSSNSASTIIPRSYHELMNWDSKSQQSGDMERRFDGEPLYWREMSKYLSGLDEHMLCQVTDKVFCAMSNYPSPSWALLWLELLRDRRIPFPLGVLRNVLKMCSYRYDLYGMIEVLQFADEERQLYEGVPAFTEKVKHLRSLEAKNLILSDTFEDSNDADSLNARINTKRSSAVEFLNHYDWNKAFLMAYRSKYANYPIESYKAAFTEVMLLMKKNGVEQSGESMQTLLRFMVQTRHDADVLQRLLKRLSSDKTVYIRHVECAAISSIILSQLQSQQYQKILSIAQPMYKSSNYLFVTQSSLSKVCKRISL
jgi:hypothetical protein